MLEMNKHFSLGDKIKISDKYHWAKGVRGTVIIPPASVVEFSDGWREVYREVASLNGKLIFYWVKFDSPQLDADADGPYAEGEIDANHLLPIGT